MKITIEDSYRIVTVDSKGQDESWIEAVELFMDLLKSMGYMPRNFEWIENEVIPDDYVQ